MGTIKLEAKADGNGVVSVSGLEAGEEVEITVVRASELRNRYPLRGTYGRYDNPFEPAIPEEDWGDAFDGT